jgi:hypothetical protein
MNIYSFRWNVNPREETDAHASHIRACSPDSETKTPGRTSRGYNFQKRKESACDAAATVDTTAALDDILVCAHHQVKPNVVPTGVLEQTCVLDRDLAVGCSMQEDDAT